MKRIVLALLLAVMAGRCRCTPAPEGAALGGRPPPPMRSGPSRNVETVLEVPPGSDPSDFGKHLQLVTVPNGEATVAFTWRGALYASKSDCARGAWLPPMKIGDSGESERPVSLALDRSNGMLAAAYVDSTEQPRVAVSKDSGMTWHAERLNPGTPGRDPSIAMAGGRAFMTWVDAAGAHSRPAAPTTWRPGADGGADRKTMTMPLRWSRWTIAESPASRGRAAHRCRSRSGADGARQHRARHRSRQRLVGHRARVLRARPRIILRGTVEGTVRSGGHRRARTPARRGAARVRLPPDGLNEPEGPISVAVSPGGQAAVVAETQSSRRCGRCGWPKVARSDDFIAGRHAAPSTTHAR